MSSFAVVCAHFYPRLTPALEEQYRLFRSQFDERGIPLLTLAVGAHYERWAKLFPELRLVAGDALFQKERLWSLGAAVAARDGFERFLCLDSDVVFRNDDWDRRLERAFARHDVIHPFERIDHRYADGSVQRRTILRFPLRISPRPADLWVARVHRACRFCLRRLPGTREAVGFGVAFNTTFLRTLGLYEYAIVGGGDGLLWDTLTRALPEAARRGGRAKPDSYLREAGFPDNVALRRSVSRWVEDGARRLGTLRVGYLDGVSAVALPNGSRGGREYIRRFEVLRRFDPDHDLRAEPEQGLRFRDGAAELKREVERYLRSRMA